MRTVRFTNTSYHKNVEHADFDLFPVCELGSSNIVLKMLKTCQYRSGSPTVLQIHQEADREASGSEDEKDKKAGNLLCMFTSTTTLGVTFSNSFPI
jgi:hypothetical protein